MVKTDTVGFQAHQVGQDKWEVKVYRGRADIQAAVAFKELQVILALTGLQELQDNQAIQAIVDHLESMGYQELVDYLVTQDGVA